MAFIMPIMARALFLRGLSSAYFSQLPPLSALWQSVQVSPSEAEKKPIVAMNSSTGMPFSTRTFLKACSAMSGFSCGGDCAPASAAVSRLAAIVPILDRTTELYMRPGQLSQNRNHRRCILQTHPLRRGSGEVWNARAEQTRRTLGLLGEIRDDIQVLLEDVPLHHRRGITAGSHARPADLQHSRGGRAIGQHFHQHRRVEAGLLAENDGFRRTHDVNRDEKVRDVFQF